QFQIAQKYTIMKMQQQHTTSTEGVEVLEDKPFEDDSFGKGRYTSKIYRFQSKAPAWLTTFAPKDALVMEEEAWNAYPRCKTGLTCPHAKNLCSQCILFLLELVLIWFLVVLFAILQCPYFSKFSLRIETVHKADNGQSENAHGLDKGQLAAREVEIIDIASAASDYWSYVIESSNFDFSKFKSVRTGRGALLEGWQDRCNPVMTAYKLVTIDAPYWGFGYRLEQALLAGERALFLESHRNCFGWIDEWFGMTMQQLELQHGSTLKEKNCEANFDGDL
ncbi:IP_trans domain-containing protein, partial [Cephalotus follicularis]